MKCEFCDKQSVITTDDNANFCSDCAKENVTKCVDCKKTMVLSVSIYTTNGKDRCQLCDQKYTEKHVNNSSS